MEYFEILACSRPCLSLDENFRAKEGGKEKTGHGPLHFVNRHSRVFRVSRSPVCEKRSVVFSALSFSAPTFLRRWKTLGIS